MFVKLMNHKVFHCSNHYVMLSSFWSQSLAPFRRQITILLKTRVHHHQVTIHSGVRRRRCRGGLSRSREYHGAGAGERERGASGHTPPGTRGPVTLTIMPLLSHTDTLGSHNIPHKAACCTRGACDQLRQGNLSQAQAQEFR